MARFAGAATPTRAQQQWTRWEFPRI